ncbi:hypothetical protein F2Q69_00005995 [Brassica cretica]|uniref:Uncharacterized protein n=1 Tax=Brassica cretica TaxID=69181 RepID=A0A8S9NZZ1_BRACR|nr:hypothetical protein F2Q69_00005995 [Brassica cretica]
MVHAQQYQKQQEKSTPILIRSCKLGTFNPQRKTLLIDRQQHQSRRLILANHHRPRHQSRRSPPSTDTRSPPSTEDTLPSTDIFHPTLINTSVQISINTEPRDMVATLILVRDENGDLHDQDGHLRNAEGQRIDARGGGGVDRHSLTTVDRRHSSVDRYLPPDVDQYFSPNIDQY